MARDHTSLYSDVAVARSKTMISMRVEKCRFISAPYLTILCVSCPGGGVLEEFLTVGWGKNF